MENVSFFESQEITQIFCDGGVVGRNPSDFGGTWAFVAVNSNDEEVFSKSGFHQTEGQPTTNNHTEMIAAIRALQAMPEGWSGTLISDSMITLGRIFEGWRTKNMPEEYMTDLRTAMKRLGKVKGKHCDGHPTKAQLEAGVGKRGNYVSRHNVEADRLCNVEVDKVKGKIASS